jgi:hypothetical protein
VSNQKSHSLFVERVVLHQLFISRAVRLVELQ